jgi:CheY-like chemotaxis protein
VLDETPAQRGTETILVAEDNDGVLELIEAVLTSLGYKVIVARDGEEAISEFKLTSSTISLVLLDMQMPKASGQEVYETIRRIKSGVPVVLTSGYVGPETELLLSTASKIALLPKPFSPMALGHKVRELLDRSAE